jgi:phosphohistidine phosphatase
MPTLVLLRHGKSAYPDGVDDHERPLNERGRLEAPIAGRRLADSLANEGSRAGERPGLDLALISSAVRAQQTWALAAPHLVVHDQLTRADLYLAELQELLEVVRALPTAARRVIFVGHNNGLEDLASALTETDVRLKTSTFAVLECDVPWAQWADGCADLVQVVIAR